MTLNNTLDLLYLIIGVAVLWVAAMLTWLLFEAAIILRNVNRGFKAVRKKVEWIGETIEGIGDRLESSSSYINAIAQGGKAVAEFIRDRKHAHEDDEDEDEDEDERPRRRRKK
jgi:hypothetical protein